jgi:hypothetical protein
LNYIDDLDWELHLSIEPSAEIAEASVKFNIKSEVSLYLGEEDMEMNLYFKDNLNMDRDLSLFLKKSEAIEENGTFRINRPIGKSIEFMNVIKNMLNLPSTVLSSSWLSKGVYHVIFIFHHTDIKAVFQILSSGQAQASEAKVQYLGPNGGYGALLNRISDRTPLSAISIQMIAPEDHLTEQMNPMGDKWIRIIRSTFGSDSIGSVYFTDDFKGEPSQFHEIVKGKTYSTFTKNPFITALNDETIKRRITPVSNIHRFEKPYFTIWITFPEIFATDYFNMIAKISKQFPEWKPVLRRLEAFGSWVVDLQ